MRYALHLVVCLCLLLPVNVVSGQDAKRTHTITIDDYFTQADIFDSQISPDGNHVAYILGRWQKSTDDRKSDLWVVNAKTAKERKLTFDRAMDRSPKWSPDSKWIYFLGNRSRAGEKRPPYDGKTQVWRIRVDGGNPLAVTRVQGGVDQFDLSPDGNFLYYIKRVESIDKEWHDLRSKYKHIDYGHGIEKYSQVWKLDLNAWRATKVIDEQRVIREFAVSRDGKRIAMITTPDGKVVSFEGQSRVDIFHLKTGKVTTLPDKLYRKDVPSPYGWLEHLAWSASGKLAFNVIFDAYPSEVVIAEWKGTEPEITFMPRPKDVSLRGYGSPIAWHSHWDFLAFLGETKGRVHVYQTNFQPAAKKHTRLTKGDVVVGSFSFSRNRNAMAAVINGPTTFPDIMLLDQGEQKRLTRVNPQADDWKLPQLSIFKWKGAGGVPVEGILELPPDYKPGQKLPTVLQIHGGPTTSNPFALRFWIYGRTLLPAKGYAVLSPNYRGSTGYGDKFITDLVGRENDIEVEDMMKGIDALVEKGIADPDRLAVMGWSNGGYLTNCIISRTTRFKAAISGAGIVDAVMEFGSNDEPAYAIVFKKGFPWTNPDRYHKASSTYQLNKIRTPTLIHVGANDERCPPGHSKLLYRALKEYVHVPTELLVYPGEGHGLTKYKNRRAKMEWDVKWLAKYVLGE